MNRRTLRPQLNQIRGWVRQGRTDAWIAHQLDVTVQQIQAFKAEFGLNGTDEPSSGRQNTLGVDDDLRAQDEEAIASELKQEESQAPTEVESDGPTDGDAEESEQQGSRRGRRRQDRTAAPLEGTFEHGDEGYGLWLDPSVADLQVYKQHWADHRPVEVIVGRDRIVIRRVDN